MKDETPIPVIVLCLVVMGLVAIELYALHQGVDGIMMSVVVAALAGIGGFTLPNLRK